LPTSSQSRRAVSGRTWTPSRSSRTRLAWRHGIHLPKCTRGPWCRGANVPGRKTGSSSRGKTLSADVGQVPEVRVTVTFSPPFPWSVRDRWPRAWSGTRQVGQGRGSPSASFPHSRLERFDAASRSTWASACIMRRWTSSSMFTHVALGWALRHAFPRSPSSHSWSARHHVPCLPLPGRFF
jgi:hypothetical protein